MCYDFASVNPWFDEKLPGSLNFLQRTKLKAIYRTKSEQQIAMEPVFAIESRAFGQGNCQRYCEGGGELFCTRNPGVGNECSQLA